MTDIDNVAACHKISAQIEAGERRALADEAARQAAITRTTSDNGEDETMNKKDIRLAKAKILMCMTEELIGGRKHSPIFNPKTGSANFGDTDLTMVMEKVVLGLYLAWNDSEAAEKAEKEQKA